MSNNMSDDSSPEDSGDQDTENGEATNQLVFAVNQLHDPGSGDHQPPHKRAKTEDSDSEVSMEQSIKQILFNINKAICLRLDSIEGKLETVNLRTKFLDEKVEMLSQQVKLNSNVVVSPNNAVKRSAVIVGLPQEGEKAESVSSENASMRGMEHAIQNLGPNVTLITLNTEEDYPHGCWLGDESNPEMRVRAPITPSDLLHVHSNCRTPEKMALTLLDYLFDRDTQATSNLSGMGKHGKKQLDPLMVYGIRCHLIHKFGITEQDWHRIKQNIDSKCRTAFRRRSRGMPLTVKAFRGKAPPTYIHMHANSSGELASDDSMQHEDSPLHIQQVQGEVDMHQPVTIQGHHGEIIQQGEIQVLHATPEQVAQLQQTHQIQILQAGDQVIQHIQPREEQDRDGIHVAVSMANNEGIQVIATDTGETVNVPLNQDVSE